MRDRLLDCSTAPARAPSLCVTAFISCRTDPNNSRQNNTSQNKLSFPFQLHPHSEQNQTWSPPPLGRASFHRTSLSLIDRASSTMAHTHGTQMASPMSMEVRKMMRFRLLTEFLKFTASSTVWILLHALPHRCLPCSSTANWMMCGCRPLPTT